MATSQEPQADEPGGIAPDVDATATATVPDATIGSTPLAEVARQLADLLRDAETAATSLRAAAEHDAATIRAAARQDAEALRARTERDLALQRAEVDAWVSAARVHADEMLGEAEATRDQAKRLLVRARARADHVMGEVEEQAASLLAEAEEQARTRMATAVTAGRARLERLEADAQRARRRLADAEQALQALARRLDTTPPIIDLTGDEPVVHHRGAAIPPTLVASPAFSAGARSDRRTPTITPTDAPARPAPTAPGTDGPATISPVGLGWVREPSPPRRRRDDHAVDRTSAGPADPAPDDGLDRATTRPDPLSSMIRTAVRRAMASSGDGA